jgi:ferredoxin
MSEHSPFAQLDDAGLNRQHVFAVANLPEDVRATLGAEAHESRLLLVGHAGRRLWECVQASAIGSEHPIDDYTRQRIAAFFAEHHPSAHYRLLYPGDQPIGLQALGRLAGWHHASPFMVGIDAKWGSWFAYRAVVLTDADFLPSTAVDRAPQEVPLGDRNPCIDCLDPPCLAACPAGALAGRQFSLTACSRYRLAEKSACAEGCLARSACPVGAEHRYDPAQIRHSYSRSLAMLRQYYSEIG